MPDSQFLIFLGQLGLINGVGFWQGKNIRGRLQVFNELVLEAPAGLD